MVAGIAIIMVLAFIVLNQGDGGEQPAETASSNSPVAEPGVFAGIDLSTIQTGLTDDGHPVLGTSDAPVTIVEFSDYQCPHCASFSKDTLPEILKNYVTAGKVRYIHNDAAILGEQSQWAAQAARCAADQGRFWEYHGLLFQKQRGENQDAFSRDNLKTFAAELGLETAAFNKCLDQNKYAQKVVQETEAAKQRGVTGTPSFFVNDELVVGNVPASRMKDIIEKHLEGSS
ncbi:MAG: DsbA family protein [Anaerolineae bacterium]